MKNLDKISRQLGFSQGLQILEHDFNWKNFDVQKKVWSEFQAVLDSFQTVNMTLSRLGKMVSTPHVVAIGARAGRDWKNVSRPRRKLLHLEFTKDFFYFIKFVKA